MLTGVGLYYDSIDNTNSNRPLAIRASDFFEPTEAGESCEGYSNFRLEEDDNTSPGCCGGYIYNKKTQVCVGDKPQIGGETK